MDSIDEGGLRQIGPDQWGRWSGLMIEVGWVGMLKLDWGSGLDKLMKCGYLTCKPPGPSASLPFRSTWAPSQGVHSLPGSCRNRMGFADLAPWAFSLAVQNREFTFIWIVMVSHVPPRISWKWNESLSLLYSPNVNCYSVLPLICKNEVQQEQLHKDTCCQAGQWSCRWASNQQLCLNSCSLIHWHGRRLVNSGQVTNCWLTSQSTCFLSSWNWIQRGAWV